MLPKFRINRTTGLELVRGDQNFTLTYTHTHTHTDTHTHTHRGPFYKSCFSAKMQKQDKQMNSLTDGILLQLFVSFKYLFLLFYHLFPEFKCLFACLF